MEMMNNSGITPIYDLADRRNGAFGDGEGSWIWIFLLFALFGGNGFGMNRQIENDALLNQEFIKRDIFNTNQNVSNTACETQREVLGNRFETQAGFSGVQRDILENRYTTTLNFKDQLYAQQQCCCETNRNIDAVRAEAYRNTCEITNAIHGEGEATRALINANTMQSLRDKLADRDRDLLTANFQLSQQAQSAALVATLQPTPKPAYLTCSPYFAYGYQPQGCGCGCGNI